ncbi:NAD(P)-dependent oxidoreductase [Hoyosella altamirensis]|uniref:3-hydroxyisobutyrate dehydrogenase-like beta-hydroxyacid dehydrogenase n=1 Tax=Hoyosella altamirensis TaxID=616997 RepID=A0A839RQS9_9ACTN|nr:NAD(P)-binding domain-containing protein [Hoyosella altamirensis]MBB3038313.1 3-hydroxyisobutyrate dehydrogenase-like beta-hydroxyacid dehydrogenase [Hoyosella altamirensis]
MPEQISAARSAPHESVAVLGLGAMGSALAQAFLRAGHPMTVWNRSSGRSSALADAGAVVADAPSVAATSADLVVLCVFDYAAAEEVVRAAGDALAGKTLVNLSNGTPAQAREMAARAVQAGARYIDGGIMTVPSMVGAKESIILYSGDKGAYTARRETLAALGTPIYLGSDFGLAAAYDIALLSAMYGMFAGARHATELVGEARATTFIRDLLVPFLTAMTGALGGDDSESPWRCRQSH